MTRLVALLTLGMLALPAAGQSPWREGLDAALADAKRTGKPVVIDFTAGWCGACKVLETRAFRDPGVHRLLSQDYIAVRVDCDQERALSDRFQVRSLPTLVVVSPNGEEVNRRTGSGEAAEISRWLNQFKGRSQAVAAAPPRRPTPSAPPVDPWLAVHRQLASALATPTPRPAAQSPRDQ